MGRHKKGLQTLVEDFSPPPDGYEDFLLHQFYWLTKFHLKCDEDASMVGDWMNRDISKESGTPIKEPNPSDPDYSFKLNELADKLASGEIESNYNPGSMYRSVLAEMWQLPSSKGGRLRPDTNIYHLAALRKLSEFYAACTFHEDRTFRGMVQLARMVNHCVCIFIRGGVAWNIPEVANHLHDEFPGMSRACQARPYRVQFDDAKAMALNVYGDTPTTRQQIELVQVMLEETTWEDSAREDLLLKGFNIDLKEGNLQIARGFGGNVIIEKKGEKKVGTGGSHVKAKPTMGQIESDAGEVKDGQTIPAAAVRLTKALPKARFADKVCPNRKK